MRLIASTLVLFVCSIAQAGLGPQNVALVVNALSPDSIAVANHYVAARNIPAANIIFVEVPAEIRETIGVNDFRRLVLEPVFEAIKTRAIDDHIDCIAYSADLPHSVTMADDVGQRKLPQVITPVASSNGLTFLYRYTLRKAPEYFSLNINFYAPLPRRGGQLTLAPPRPFSHSTGWNFDGAAVPDRPARGYMLSTVIGVTAGRGNKLEEIAAMIHRSAAADFSAPTGVIYLMSNADIRSKTRAWGFDPTVEKLKEIGVKAIIETGSIPQKAKDIAGIVAGIESFDFAKSGSTILPGAICEHLTSFGGALRHGMSQTPITDWIRAGASGSSGTVTEPFAIQEKFPTPLVQYYYASGCTLAEAFYQSVSGPYQLLIIGDPLCKPWARRMDVIPGIEPGAVLKGNIALKPACKGPINPARFRLLLDGQTLATIEPDKEFALDTTKFPDGHHDLRLIAIGADPLETQGQAILPVTFGNKPQAALAKRVGSAKVVASSTIDIEASCKGASKLTLIHLGRPVATLDAEQGTFKIPAVRLGLGPVRLQVQADIKQGDQTSKIASPPLDVDISAK